MDNKLRQEINEDLLDEEIVDLVIDLNKKQIKNIKKSSLYNIFLTLNSAKVLMQGDSLDSDKYREELEELEGYLEKLKLLTLEDRPGELRDLREKILLKKNILEGYLIELNFIGELVDEEGVKLLSDNKEHDLDPTKRLMETTKLINLSLDQAKENYGKYIFTISEIIKVLPMNLVKSNYYDILKTTIKRNFFGYNKVLVDANIDNYKRQFDSSLSNGYGMEFDYFFMEIQKLKREDISQLGLDDLALIVDKIIDLTGQLSILRDLVLSLGLVSNLIFVVNNEDTEDIKEGEDLGGWQELYEEADPKKLEKYNQDLAQDLGAIEQEIQEDLVLYENLTRILSKREGLDDQLLEEELLNTREILAFYNDVNFTDISYIENFTIEPVPVDYIENCIESLIHYMDRSMSYMSNKERKIRMRKVLSILELPFDNIQAFTDYISYSLDSRMVDKKIVNFKLNQITYFLEEIRDK